MPQLRVRGPGLPQAAAHAVQLRRREADRTPAGDALLRDEVVAGKGDLILKYKLCDMKRSEKYPVSQFIYIFQVAQLSSCCFHPQRGILMF